MFATNSAEETTKLVSQHGGQVVKEPHQVFNKGIMAAFTDPEGIPFAVWQPLESRGMPKYDDQWKTGILTWSECNTRDADKAFQFYSSVFGYEQTIGDHDYRSWLAGDYFACGAMAVKEAEWADSPGHWMTYVNVDNVDAACEKVKELGGTIRVGPVTIPDMITFAIVVDPVGVVVSICSGVGTVLDRAIRNEKKLVKQTRQIIALESQIRQVQSVISEEESDSHLLQILKGIFAGEKSDKKRSREEPENDELPVKKLREDE